MTVETSERQTRSSHGRSENVANLLVAATPTGGSPRKKRGNVVKDAQANRNIVTKPKVVHVTTQEHAKQFSRSVHAVVGVAVEWAFVNKKKVLSLVQISQKDTVYMFDMLSADFRNVGCVFLRRVFEHEQITKVFHDCREQSQLLRDSVLEVKNLRNVIDTQILHAMRGDVGDANVCKERVSLNTLLQCYDLPVNQHRKTIADKVKQEASFWLVRPLPQVAIDYATTRVCNLEALYESMYEKLNVLLHEMAAVISLEHSEVSLNPNYNELNALVGLDRHLTFSDDLKPIYSSSFPTPEAPLSSPSRSAPTSPADVTPPEELDAMLSALMEKSLNLGPLSNTLALNAFLMKEGFAFESVKKFVKYMRVHGEKYKEFEPIDEDFVLLAEMWPEPYKADLLQFQRRLTSKINEITIDIGVPVALRTCDGKRLELDDEEVDETDFREFLKNLKNLSFSTDNRAGIEGQLHRISVMRSRAATRSTKSLTNITGITYRVGRHVSGLADMIIDVLATMANSVKEAGKEPLSLLLLGSPGVGKTTLLRDAVSVLAKRLQVATVIVDTSNEIGGDGVTPHASIRPARRMMVPCRSEQYQQLLEAVQNHSPELVVVDELSDRAEVSAVQTIAQRGVSMIATAHGVSLASLLRNPDLRALVGGVKSVTLGDVMLKEKKLALNDKTTLQRERAPVFNMLVEMRSRNDWILHTNVAQSVDAMLAPDCTPPIVEHRYKDAKTGHFHSVFERAQKVRMDTLNPSMLIQEVKPFHCARRFVTMQ